MYSPFLFEMTPLPGHLGNDPADRTSEPASTIAEKFVAEKLKNAGATPSRISIDFSVDFSFEKTHQP
jgi:hypothetical protein